MSTDIININQVEITLPREGEIVFVPIKPICEVLGIQHAGQMEGIKNHPILGSVVQPHYTTGGDGKRYEMLCLPIKYVFGWLLSIDARKVKPEAAEAVIQYQEKAYDALYDYFYLEPTLQKNKLLEITRQENLLLKLEQQRRDITAQIKAEKEKLEEIKATPVGQIQIGFPNTETHEA